MLTSRRRWSLLVGFAACLVFLTGLPAVASSGIASTPTGHETTKNTDNTDGTWTHYASVGWTSTPNGPYANVYTYNTNAITWTAGADSGYTDATVTMFVEIREYAANGTTLMTTWFNNGPSPFLIDIMAGFTTGHFTPGTMGNVQNDHKMRIATRTAHSDNEQSGNF